MQYRPEIDGLRAFAVLPVIFFHLNVGLFSGGFLGVDVFFVISGFLITSIIIEGKDKGSFSIFTFYERRARRILPTLLLVCIVSIPLVSAFYAPRDLEDFSQSILATLTFSSNILFWQESGYFSGASHIKPLLHTWSLAVEEQFYVLFPIFMYLAWKLGKRFTLISLIIICILSLCLAHWAATNRSGNGAFYLLPTRGWELMLGSIAAFVNYYRAEWFIGVSKVGYQNVLSFLGLVLVVSSFLIFNNDTPTPSLLTLVPTLGTLMIILFARQGTIAFNLLKNKIFVSIGLVSYSAYLWHFPITAVYFYLYASIDVLSILAVIAVTFMLSFLSWRYIEKPFRSFSTVSIKKFLVIICIAYSILAAFGLYGHFSNGFDKIFKNYLTEGQLKVYGLIQDNAKYNLDRHMHDNEACNFWNSSPSEAFIQRFEECAQLHGKAMLVLGDSHAMNLYNIVAKTDNFPFLIGLSQGGCRPQNNKPGCHYNDTEVFLDKYKHQVSSVYFHQSGSYFVLDEQGRPDSQATFEGSFAGYALTDIDNTIGYLEKLGEKLEKRIHWIGPFLEYRYSPIKAIKIEKYRNVNPVSIDIFSNIDSIIEKQINEQSIVKYASFNDLYQVPLKAIQDDCFIFRDIDHFSHCGEALIAKEINLKFFNSTNELRN